MKVIYAVDDYATISGSCRDDNPLVRLIRATKPGGRLVPATISSMTLNTLVFWRRELWNVFRSFSVHSYL
jgi:hypothetical protein